MKKSMTTITSDNSNNNNMKQKNRRRKKPSTAKMNESIQFILLYGLFVPCNHYCRYVCACVVLGV